MNQIESQLAALRLHGMRQSWQALLETRQHLDLSLTDGLQVLLQSEELTRGNSRSARLRKTARFRYQASLEEIRYDSARGLDKSLIAGLASGNYIQQGESLIITGATGCGKSFLASALGHHACQQGYKVAYFNMQKLLIKTKMARIEGSSAKCFDQLANAKLLILDDFGLTHLEKQQQLDLLEIVEDRHGKASTIIVSQLPVAAWFDIIGEPTIADAILDRFIHTAYRIELKGESQRKKL